MGMRYRQMMVLIALCSMAVLAIYVVSSHRLRRSLPISVANVAVKYAKWSEDSDVLFYVPYVAGNGHDSVRLCMYDLRTGVSQSHTLSDKFERNQGIDVSSDGLWLIYARNLLRYKAERRHFTYEVYLVNLATSREKCIAQKDGQIAGIRWSRGRNILIDVRYEDGRHDIDLMAVDRRPLHLVTQTLGLIESSCDGGSFIYVDTIGRYHLYRLATKEDMVLDLAPRYGSSEFIQVVYMNDYRVIWRRLDDSCTYYTQMDFLSGRKNSIRIFSRLREFKGHAWLYWECVQPAPGNILSLVCISPDLKKCLVAFPGDVHPSDERPPERPPAMYIVNPMVRVER